jgi:hypothetical protein
LTIIDFLNIPIFYLPKERDPAKDGDLVEYIKSTNKVFLDAVDKIDTDDEVGKHVLADLTKVRDLCAAIEKAIEEYFNGHPQLAYGTLCEKIREMSPELEKLVQQTGDPTFHDNLYRIRVLEDRVFEKKEMFHIPYNLRHVVKTQRYSIPGFPSLYLSSSLFTAWKELGTPDLNKIVAIRVNLSEPIKILDFGNSPQYLAPLYNVIYQKPGEAPRPNKPRAIEYMSSYIKCWPLIFACSIAVLEKNGSFKPEYIIPQILLQAVRNNEVGVDIDGIRYLSTHVDQYLHAIHRSCNYVFPVKSNAKSGLCSHLKSKFSLTEAISWQLANAITDSPDKTLIQGIQIELLKGVLTPYAETDFGRMEARLLGLTATKLT